MLCICAYTCVWLMLFNGMYSVNQGQRQHGTFVCIFLCSRNNCTKCNYCNILEPGLDLYQVKTVSHMTTVLTGKNVHKLCKNYVETGMNVRTLQMKYTTY